MPGSIEREMIADLTVPEIALALGKAESTVRVGVWALSSVRSASTPRRSSGRGPVPLSSEIWDHRSD